LNYKPTLDLLIDRMIPPLEENGMLPPGIHQASLDEIDDRFGQESEIRRTQMQSLRWLIDLAKLAGAERLIINGSFVTDAFEPNDVDCVLLTDPNHPNDPAALDEIAAGLPFLDVQLVELTDFTMLVEQFFATDRFRNSKGLVEVIL
jgi:hypothetical protein